MESFEILNKIEKLKKEIRSAELALLDKYNKNINKSLKVFISKKRELAKYITEKN
mgnify:CR=1 FL=1